MHYRKLIIIESIVKELLVEAEVIDSVNNSGYDVSMYFDVRRPEVIEPKEIISENFPLTLPSTIDIKKNIGLIKTPSYVVVVEVNIFRLSQLLQLEPLSQKQSVKILTLI